jgi:hypothetical protein
MTEDPKINKRRLVALANLIERRPELFSMDCYVARADGPDQYDGRLLANLADLFLEDHDHQRRHDEAEAQWNGTAPPLVSWRTGQRSYPPGSTDASPGLTIKCGNPRHPSGQWHQSDPLPSSWDLFERFCQWRNRRHWGCGCYVRERFKVPPVLKGPYK